MTQAHILEKAKQFISSNNSTKIFDMLHSKEEKPNTTTVGEILKIAAKADKDFLIDWLLSDKNPVQPEFSAVKEAFLLTATSSGYLGLKTFCSLSLKGTHQLGYHIMEEGLFAAATGGFTNAIHVLLMDNPVKFQIETIVQAFIKAIASGTDDIIIQCVKNNTDLRFDFDLVYKGLLVALDEKPNEQLALKYTGRLERIKALRALSDSSEAHLDTTRKTIETSPKSDDAENQSTETSQTLKRKIEQKFRELYQHIENLRLYGETLQQLGDEKSKDSGSYAVDFANNLIPIVDDYREEFFNQNARAAIQKLFASTLTFGFNSMGDHRAQWKIYLVNIMIAATGIGLLINYLVNGHMFFSNTNRQNKIQTILDDLDGLESTNSLMSLNA